MIARITYEGFEILETEDDKVTSEGIADVFIVDGDKFAFCLSEEGNERPSVSFDISATQLLAAIEGLMVELEEEKEINREQQRQKHS